MVIVIHKELTILGGFTHHNWTTPDPDVNRTIIDGENHWRGILAEQHDGHPATTVEMAGFTVQNGYVKGESHGSDADISVFGAGLLSDSATVILRDMVFRNNRAVGGDTASDYGGSGTGGGIALRGVSAGSTLENVTFEGNQALGGSGSGRGGYGIGGGLYTFRSTLTGRNLNFVGNVSRGGDSNGAGVDSINENGDGQGGGAAFHVNSNITLVNARFATNKALGGSAPNGQGGGGFGGGVFAEADSRVELREVHFFDNEARGGNGLNASSHGSVAVGGGLGVLDAQLVVEQSSFINNRALGGDGAALAGSAGGGGISLMRNIGATHQATIRNTIIANNRVRMGAGNPSDGGGGGGIFLLESEASIGHTTFAQNEVGPEAMQGSAIVLNFNSKLNLLHSIIAQHPGNGGASALFGHSGNAFTLERGLFDDNEQDYDGPATFAGLNTMLRGDAQFVSPGAPHYDYHIQELSHARQSASSSMDTFDIDGDPRDLEPDIGADEYVLPEIVGVSNTETTASSALIQWNSQGSGIDHFGVSVTCSRGASAPDGYPCGATVDVGLAEQVRLTGLSSDATYGVEVTAFDLQGTRLDSFSTSFTTGRPLFLPIVTGRR